MIQEAPMTIDYGAAFGFFFKDRDWLKKFAIASLLTYTLVGSIPVLGWSLEITHGVIRGEPAGLPAWTDFRGLWKAGYKYWLVTLAWLLPLILSILVLYLPLIFARSIEGDILLVIFAAVLCGELVFLLVYSCIYIFLLPAAMGLLAGTGSLRRTINPVNAWRAARRHFSPHLIVFFIVGIGLLNLLALLAPLTLFLLVPPMLVYAGIVAAHYAGQLYRLDS
jgi:hypothetical protein